MNSEIEELKALLKINGVALPPAPPERPVASIEDIPPGARINDVEILLCCFCRISKFGLVTCSQVMGKMSSRRCRDAIWPISYEKRRQV